MTGRTKVIVVRHGECAGNIEDRVRGRSEFPLNANGIKQAYAVAEALKDETIACVYTSPLDRTIKTAEIIAQKGNFKVEIETRFNNMSFGPWEGRKKSDIAAAFPEEWKTWLTIPESLCVKGAETFDEVQRRSVEATLALTGKHRGGVFAVVSHRGLIKPMLAGLLGIGKPAFWKLYVDNASICVLSHTEAQGFTLMELNNTNHLRGLPLVREYV